MVRLKHVSNFWRILEINLINCEISPDLSWSKNYITVVNNEDQGTKFSITDTKLYVPVVTLSTQDNSKQLEELKFGFKKQLTRININPK